MKKKLCFMLCTLLLACTGCGKNETNPANPDGLTGGPGGTTGVSDESDSGTEFTLDYILNKVGREKLSEREFEVGGVMGHNYWFCGTRETNYDKMDFYLFDSKEDAAQAFDYMKEKWIDAPAEQDDTSIEGTIYACDADIYEYIFWNSNLIITAELDVMSTWADESADGGDYSGDDTLTRDNALISDIRSF